MVSEEFQRVIEFLKLLALTLPAIGIYMRIIRERYAEQKERNDTGRNMRPYKQIIVFSEISLASFLAALVMMVIILTGKGPLKGFQVTLSETSAVLMVGGYTFWLLAVVRSIWQERSWMKEG